MNTKTTPKKTPTKGRSTMDALAGLAPPGRSTSFIPHDNIRPDPDQPRTQFRPVDGMISDAALQSLRDLANNILHLGLKQPITVRPDPARAGKYIINMGERRWRAVGLLREEGRPGFDEIECFIEEDDRIVPVMRLEQLAENIQREDLSDLEIATFLRRLLEDYQDLQQQDLCILLDKPKQWVSRMLGLLDPKYAELVSEGYIKYAAILEQYKALPAHRQEQLANEARATGNKITSGAIRRHAEAAKASGEKAPRAGKAPSSPEVEAAVRAQFDRVSSSQQNATMAVAVAVQEVRIKGAQAATLLKALPGRDIQVSMRMTSADLRDAIAKLGGEVPENDLMLTTALYGLLGLKE